MCKSILAGDKTVGNSFDISKLIEERRSVRSYRKDPLGETDVRGILSAGRWSPSPSNVQSWRFGVITDEDGLLTLVKNLSPGFPNSAPLGFVVCSNSDELDDFSEEERVFLRSAEAAMATQNMMLFAWSKGIGTCVVASFSRGGVSEALDLPDSIVPVLLIAAGYPKIVPEPPIRKDLEKITFRGNYN